MPRPGAGESPAAGMWLASDCPSSVLQLTFGAGQAPHLAIDLKAHKGLLQWSLTPGNFALLHVCPAHSVLHQNDSMPGARSGQGVLFLSHQEERQKPTVCALRFQAPQACRECAALLQVTASPSEDAARARLRTTVSRIGTRPRALISAWQSHPPPLLPENLPTPEHQARHGVHESRRAGQCNSSEHHIGELLGTGWRR